MTPNELHTLFSDKEQTLLVSTERARLADLSEDELGDLLTRVRRARNKYSKLYRRQSADLVAASSSRAGTSTSNTRTRRKAEIFEDALSRVALALSRAARSSADELKQERLAAARVAKGSPRQGSGRSEAAALDDQPGAGGGASRGRSASKARRSSNQADGARRQRRRDDR
jgi:hypothetical protein